jgi:hypothetical protein
VTVSASAAAAALPAGIYSDSITFSNTTSGIAQSRTVTIRIGQPDFFTENFSAGDFDLAFTTLTFTPDGSTSFYRLCREPAAVFPTDPAGGTPVTLGDDTYLFTALAGGATVSIYGQSGGSFYIGANGHLTLTASNHTDFFYPELAVYFERARVSALYADLNPATGGSVSWRQLSNRVAVTYLAVPEYGVNNTNNFQMELFFNGIIRVTWLEIDAVNALVGLSRGTGQPAGFVESDFSLSSTCAIQPPRLRLDRVGEDLQFTWLPDITPFRLETAANLKPPVAWADVTNSVAFTNGLNTVRLPPTNGQRFFRLVAP